MGKKYKRLPFENARDRLFTEMHRCDVLEADDEGDVEAWLDDTVAYLGEEFRSLNFGALDKLKRAGRNYAAPAIPYGGGKDATNREEWSDEAGEAGDE